MKLELELEPQMVQTIINALHDQKRHADAAISTIAQQVNLTSAENKNNPESPEPEDSEQ